MMIESGTKRQFRGGVKRRWFSDNYFDLIVWEDEKRDIVRFELCYNKFKDEHAYVWNQQDGYDHLKVDDGEDGTERSKMSPIFVADGYFDREALAAKFLEAGKDIDQDIAQFVYSKLKDYNEIHKRGQHLYRSDR